MCDHGAAEVIDISGDFLTHSTIKYVADMLGPGSKLRVLRAADLGLTHTSLLELSRRLALLWGVAWGTVACGVEDEFEASASNDEIFGEGEMDDRYTDEDKEEQDDRRNRLEDFTESQSAHHLEELHLGCGAFSHESIAPLLKVLGNTQCGERLAVLDLAAC